MGTTYLDHEQRQEGAATLLGAALGLAGGGAFLLRFAGPPRLPTRVPAIDEIVAALRGSDVPYEALAYILTTAAWLLWLWIVGSLVVHGVVVCAERLSRGATWTRPLRWASERVTLPLARRVVEGAFATVLFVNVVARPAPAAAAPPPAAVATVLSARPVEAAVRPALDLHERHARPETGGVARHVVQPGDTLWSIAERHYGTGEEYPRLLAANAGRPMIDGRTFTSAGVIQPGWELIVPLPSRTVLQEAGQRWYVVEEGDTLRGIAARLLGDEMRWPEVFEPNRGTARLEDGRALTDPDLIWPGLRLRLPGEAEAPAPDAPPAAVPLRAPDRDDPGLRRPAVPPAPVPVVAAPTAAPAPVLPAAATVTPAATAIAAPVLEVETLSENEGPSPLALGAAAAGVAVGGALLLRRRFRRSLNDPPIASAPRGDAVVRDGFADADPERVLPHRLEGASAEPAVLLTDHALRFLGEHGLDAVEIVTVEHGRRTAALTLTGTLAERDRLLELGPAFGARLGVGAEAALTPDHDVVWRLADLAATSLVTAGGPPPDLSWLVPIGALPGRETLHADWRRLGHVLVAGTPGGGADVVVTGLVAGLTARQRPEQLELWTIADRRALPERLGDLPHQRAAPTDPEDRDAAAAVLGDLLAELDRRRASPEAAGRPEIVLVLGEAAALDGGTALETIGLDGPEHGIRVLAATTSPGELDDATLTHFRTRVVLRTATEDESIQLLDAPAAADLGGAGDLLVRIDARAPIHARGFRVAAEHLDRLVALMRTAYGAPPARTTSTDTADAAGSGEPPAAAAVPSATPSESAYRVLSPSDVAPKVNGHGSNGHHPPAAVATEDVPAVVDAEGPPLQVVCFGGPRVLLRGQEIWPNGETNGRHKTWELLCFLAAQPTEVVARDKLLAALWPDLDADEASNRLKHNVYHLRCELAERDPALRQDVLKIGRDGTCRLGGSVARSDVHRFAALCRQAGGLPSDEAMKAYREARAAYGGDLLIGGAYEWLGERDESGLTLTERYREMHRKATARLADLCYKAGQVAVAIELYRELLQAEPTLEAIARNLFRCHHKLGDKHALVCEEEQLRRKLKEAFYDPEHPDQEPGEYQLEPETTALFERLLRDLQDRAGPANTPAETTAA